MSTALIIGGVVLGVAVLAGVAMMGKKKEDSEDTGFGVENQSGGRSRTRSRRSHSRRSKRVKI
jgi:hypothetical protein